MFLHQWDHTINIFRALFTYLFERERVRESAQQGGTERVLSRLHTESTEPNAGLQLTIPRSQPAETKSLKSNRLDHPDTP